jgi:hypothetical protein
LHNNVTLVANDYQLINSTYCIRKGAMITSKKSTIIKPGAVLLGLIITFGMFAYLSTINYSAHAQVPGLQTEDSANNSTNTTGSSSISAGKNQPVVGRIVSVVNDQSGKPDWILSGKWTMQVPTVFNATITMQHVDGSDSHKHRIIDFKPIGNPVVNPPDLTAMNGTATVSTEGSDFTNVPASVSLHNNSTLNITLDPVKTHNHFGNGAIYGVIVP